MRDRLRRWSIKFGLFWVRLGGWNVVYLEDRLLKRARIITRDVNLSIPTASGEAKRHQAYARLQKEFPTLPHRTLALAIEYSL